MLTRFHSRRYMRCDRKNRVHSGRPPRSFAGTQAAAQAKQKFAGYSTDRGFGLSLSRRRRGRWRCATAVFESFAVRRRAALGFRSGSKAANPDCLQRVGSGRVALPDSRALAGVLRDWRALPDGRRLENQIDAAIAAAWAHHPLTQSGQWHIAPSRPDQRLKAQLAHVMAIRGRASVCDLAVKTPSMDAPSGCKSLPEGFDLHENRMRTCGGAGQLCRADSPIRSKCGASGRRRNGTPGQGPDRRPCTYCCA